MACRKPNSPDKLSDRDSCFDVVVGVDSMAIYTLNHIEVDNAEQIREEIMEDEEKRQEVHDWYTEQIWLKVKWLTQNQTRPTNYLVVIIVSMLSSALTAWLFTH